MIMSLARLAHAVPAAWLAGALMTVEVQAAAFPPVGSSPMPERAVTAAATWDEGLPGDGHPPLPGPTNPNGPAS
jgi:hypothetical protein